MSDEKLRKSLARLKKAMEELDESDETSRQKLARVIEDVQRKLNREETSQPEKPLSAQIKDAIVHFEVKHPTITSILNDISMVLSNMGL